MDFAKKILSKYGWKEGDGLGKNNTGMAAPLKASLKFDNAGLGVDRAQEFNDHWWERCFNEAASNVDVQVQDNGQISTARKEGEEAVEISTKAYSARKLKKAKDQHASDGKATYDNFLQTALLTQGGGEVENTERIRVEDIAVAKINVLTDEELFKACGGRTAHKGARHGLKLSGKIARLEQQEREMLEKLQGKQKSDAQPEPAKKKKKSKEATEREPEEATQEKETEEPIKTKKKKKDKKSREVSAEEEIESSEDSLKKSKKKHKSENADEEIQENPAIQDTEEPIKLKKKKKDKKPKQESPEEEIEASEESLETSKKKRKTENPAEETEEPVKAKKKKKKCKDQD
ncbi:hypothetical protein KR018_000034 [Drosophila ironensis]|nr:hypothetical protein KR018_000034 [Drosophila ironensis]